MFADTDNNYMRMFLRGLSLPYDSYDEGRRRKILNYKKNNLSAIAAVVDGVNDYVNDENPDIPSDTLNSLIHEIGTFTVNGLFGIGFYGISVEDGKPIRVDSMGMNISKKYNSVYRNMTQEEYESLDRIDSMILDQRENRKFLRYLARYKCEISKILVPYLGQEDDSDEKCSLLVQCLAIDETFRSIARVVSRNGGNTQRLNVYDILSIMSKVRELLKPWRAKLQADNVTSIKSYTSTDLQPIKAL